MGNGMGRAGSTEKKELRVEEKKCKNFLIEDEWPCRGMNGMASRRR